MVIFFLFISNESTSQQGGVPNPLNQSRLQITFVISKLYCPKYINCIMRHAPSCPVHLNQYFAQQRGTSFIKKVKFRFLQTISRTECCVSLCMTQTSEGYVIPWVTFWSLCKTLTLQRAMSCTETWSPIHRYSLDLVD